MSVTNDILEANNCLKPEKDLGVEERERKREREREREREKRENS